MVYGGYGTAAEAAELNELERMILTSSASSVRRSAVPAARLSRLQVENERRDQAEAGASEVREWNRMRDELADRVRKSGNARVLNREAEATLRKQLQADYKASNVADARRAHEALAAKRREKLEPHLAMLREKAKRSVEGQSAARTRMDEHRKQRFDAAAATASKHRKEAIALKGEVDAARQRLFESKKSVHNVVRSESAVDSDALTESREFAYSQHKTLADATKAAVAQWKALKKEEEARIFEKGSAIVRDLERNEAASRARAHAMRVAAGDAVRAQRQRSAETISKRRREDALAAKKSWSASYGAKFVSPRSAAKADELTTKLTVGGNGDGRLSTKEADRVRRKADMQTEAPLPGNRSVTFRTPAPSRAMTSRPSSRPHSAPGAVRQKSAQFRAFQLSHR